MPAVNFPRDAHGRIITDPTVPDLTTPAETPSVPTVRPLRAIDPRLHAAPGRTGAPAAATARPPTHRLRLALVAVAALLLVAALIVLLGRVTPAAPTRPLSVPTAVATPLPTATPFGTPLGAAIVAYFDYAQLETATALERGTHVQPIARIAHAWVLLELADHTNVWVRWRDLPALALDSLPDRATPTPLPPTPLPPTAVPVVVPPPAPTGVPTPLPTACIRSIYGKDCGVGLGDPTSVVATQQARTDAYARSWAATATAQAGHR